MTVTTGSVLSDTLLQACRQRAAGYDRDNKFCKEDFDELRAAGYLMLTVPPEFGGQGYTLNQYTREARRLANFAPATALCLNMHHYWVGTAADSWRMGDKTVGFILEEAGKGEVFAAGHAEPGNETSIVMSATKAEKVPGGYKFTGRKAFGSLSPVWTRLGLHGLDTSDPKNPKVVHGFLPRNTPGVTIKETWDVLGMRATRSDDTILEGAFVPDKNIARVVPM
jgi:alkylation response protein AidB-like acyl-CoA dehydrogenase